MTTTTFTVYTLSPRGSFSQRYQGTDEVAALTAYNKLVDAKKPRILNKIEEGTSQAVMLGGGFPQ